MFDVKSASNKIVQMSLIGFPFREWRFLESLLSQDVNDEREAKKGSDAASVKFARLAARV